MLGSEGTESLGSKDTVERPDDVVALCGVGALSGKYAGEGERVEMFAQL